MAAGKLMVTIKELLPIKAHRIPDNILNGRSNDFFIYLISGVLQPCMNDLATSWTTDFPFILRVRFDTNQGAHHDSPFSTPAVDPGQRHHYKQSPHSPPP